MWLDDHGWWVTLVEFQPSGSSKGSFLNVGVHWLWHDKDHWSFDAGYREEGFVPYRGDDQFLPEARRLAARAAEKVSRLREQLSTIASVADFLMARCDLANPWDLYHAGVACGLDGRASDAMRLLGMLWEAPATTEWQQELRTLAGSLFPDAGAAERLRMRMLEVVQRARESLGLAPRDISFVLGS